MTNIDKRILSELDKRSGWTFSKDLVSKAYPHKDIQMASAYIGRRLYRMSLKGWVERRKFGKKDIYINAGHGWWMTVDVNGWRITEGYDLMQPRYDGPRILDL